MKQFTFWVTVAEKEQIRDTARRVGLTPSAYVRAAALGAKLRTKPGLEAQEVTRQLARLGNNLNQLRAVADRRASWSVASLDEARAQLRDALRRWSDDGAARPAPRAVAELAHQGATVNSLAWRANAGRFPAVDELREALVATVAAIKAVCR